MNLKRIISELVEKKCEGGYWDYKESHCENKADLIHDIICMANNLCNKDAYIIYGVCDKTAEIKGVENSKLRRNQQEMVNQIKGKKFAGGIRPFIELKVIEIDGHELDILIVKNSTNTPFHLVESFRHGDRTIRANHIYTRVNDTNTDIDKTTDINHIEYLWRKRFGIDKPPIEKLNIALDDYNNWIYKSDLPYYNEFFPEFHIEYDTNPSHENDLSHERYCGFYINPKASFYYYKIFYHSTVLFDSVFLYLDETRITISDPKSARFTCNNREFRYYYFEKDSIIGKMLRLFTKSTYDTTSRFLGEGAFLVFDNEEMRKEFEEYVKSHLDIYDNISLDAHAERAVKYEKENQWDIKFCESMARLYQLFILWKKEEKE